MIRGRCCTNLDEYRREKWPIMFAAVPRKGERVEAASGRTLKVVDVTHTMIKESPDFGDQADEIIPFIIVELHNYGG